MSGSEVSSVDNILQLRTYTIEERRTKNKSPCQLLRTDSTFERIWTGGLLRGMHLSLRFQLSEDEYGRLLYNGRLYNRSAWTWQPPKFIRLQGRHAKEIPDPCNNYPTDIIEEDNKKIRVRRVCDNEVDGEVCGGRLLYDLVTMDLYCERCKLISE